MRMLEVTERDELGYAVDPNGGGTWRVVATSHNRDWPTHNDRTTFACEHVVNGSVVEAVGFFSEKECWDYLTGIGEKEYTVYDQGGVEETVKREGKRIPDGLVKRYVADVSANPVETPTTTTSPAPWTEPTTTSPAPNAATEAYRSSEAATTPVPDAYAR